MRLSTFMQSLLFAFSISMYYARIWLKGLELKVATRYLWWFLPSTTFCENSNGFSVRFTSAKVPLSSHNTIRTFSIDKVINVIKLQTTAAGSAARISGAGVCSNHKYRLKRFLRANWSLRNTYYNFTGLCSLLPLFHGGALSALIEKPSAYKIQWSRYSAFPTEILRGMRVERFSRNKKRARERESGLRFDLKRSVLWSRYLSRDCAPRVCSRWKPRADAVFRGTLR